MDKESDARTRKILNRLLIVLVLVSAIAGLILRSLDHADPEINDLKSAPEKNAPENKNFDPIPDPIPDPIQIPSN